MAVDEPETGAAMPQSRSQARSTAPSKKSRKRRSQVPGSYLGYSLQATRFVQLLISGSPGMVVSLEVFEDVGTQDNSGQLLASQVKSARKSNPIADRSVDLWKTFANWLEELDKGDLPIDHTHFEIYVSSLQRGAIAESFHAAMTEEDAEKALVAARAVLWGDPGLFGRTGTLPAGLDCYVNRVLGSSEPTMLKLLPRFRLTFPCSDPLADIKAKIASTQWLPTESTDVLAQHALGWVKEQTDDLIRKSRPASIEVDAFNTEMRAFARRCDLRTMLISFAGKPSAEAVKADLIRTYVRQLELIEAADEDKIQAINDYLRAAVDRTEWSRRGIVHRSSLDEFEELLLRFWKNKRRQNDIAQKHLDEIERGKFLYSDCCMHHPSLQGLEVPPYFPPGSYHSLADDQVLGWHPNYRKKLQGGKQGSNE